MSKKENDLIQAAVAAKLAGKEIQQNPAEDLDGLLPDGVEAVEEYSAQDSREKLLAIAAQLGVEIKKGATKPQIVATLDKWIADHAVSGEEADALLAQQSAQDAQNVDGDTVDANVEKGTQSAPKPAVAESWRGIVETVYNGYTNVRRDPAKAPHNVAQTVRTGTRFEAVGHVEDKDGQGWFVLASGLYIIDDPAVVKFTRK